MTKKSRPIDPATQFALEYQGRRMRAALGACPPDRKEAALIQRRVDDILDRRPNVVGMAPDGELIFDNASSWIQDQGHGVLVNDTGHPEVVLTAEQMEQISKGASS